LDGLHLCVRQSWVGFYSPDDGAARPGGCGGCYMCLGKGVVYDAGVGF
jgi:hypothetical protein